MTNQEWLEPRNVIDVVKREVAIVKSLSKQDTVNLPIDIVVSLIQQAELEEQTIQLNKRYRKAIESMKSEINYALYSHKSKEVKRYYLENAVRYADEALEGKN